MAKVYLLMGIPGSGKSHFGKKLAEEKNAVYFSSDGIREKLYGDEDAQGERLAVFDALHEEIHTKLAEGYDIVYDATNTNRKRRIHLIDQVLRGHEVIAHALLTSYDTCLLRNNNRERVVPVCTMDRMYQNFQMPFLTEGFKEVFYHTEAINHTIPNREELERVLLGNVGYEELFGVLNQIPEFQKIYEMPQDSTYHSFSVSRHMYYVYKGVHEGSELKIKRLDPIEGWVMDVKHVDAYSGPNLLKMAWSGVLHDLGKGFTKSFYNHEGKETRYASFIGHEAISSYLAFHYLTHLGYDIEFILDVVKLVGYHMLPKNMSRKTEKKLKNWLSEEAYNELILFNDYDNSAK